MPTQSTGECSKIAFARAQLGALFIPICAQLLKVFSNPLFGPLIAGKWLLAGEEVMGH